jgi:hypothetical protein
VLIGVVFFQGAIAMHFLISIYLLRKALSSTLSFVASGLLLLRMPGVHLRVFIFGKGFSRIGGSL